jgi:hypothetical protein
MMLNGVVEEDSLKTIDKHIQGAVDDALKVRGFAVERHRASWPDDVIERCQTLRGDDMVYRRRTTLSVNLGKCRIQSTELEARKRRTGHGILRHEHKLKISHARWTMDESIELDLSW